MCAASRHDIDATTEAAALVVIGAGLAAGVGSLALASGIIAISTLLLVEKSRLHALVGRIDDEELRAAARFGVMAIVILPLLPEGPDRPVRRHQAARVVAARAVLHRAELRRLSGAPLLRRRPGYPLAGLLGGLISSTNVTFTFARLSRGADALATARDRRHRRVHDAVSAGAGRGLRAESGGRAAAAALSGGAVRHRRRPRWRSVVENARACRSAEPPGQPAAIGPALQMAALFQIGPLRGDGAGRAFGDSGLLVSGAVLGLTDVDALTISMTTTPTAGACPPSPRQVIAVGILANCLMKAVAVALGTPRFARMAAGPLTGMAVALGAALWTLRSLR